MKTAVERNDTDSMIEAVKAWLSIQRNSKWMLVFDNVDDPQAYDINVHLPETHQGSLLITSRSSYMQIGKVVYVPLEKLTDAKESIEILAQTSRREISDQGQYRYSRYRSHS